MILQLNNLVGRDAIEAPQSYGADNTSHEESNAWTDTLLDIHMYISLAATSSFSLSAAPGCCLPADGPLHGRGVHVPICPAFKLEREDPDLRAGRVIVVKSQGQKEEEDE